MQTIHEMGNKTIVDYEFSLNGGAQPT